MDLTRAGTLEDIHAACFGTIWQWSGNLRQRELSIGVEPASRRQRLPEGLGTLAWQIENGAAAPEWIALNTHHRLVHRHPFTDGNGRVTRLFADALLFALTDGTRVFDWIEDVPIYLEALRAADSTMSPEALLAVIGVREV
ncbi:Fic family protein [Cryobacterium aureum]|uniref:Fic family protein n=1 Tax=Cryobacterium aureum TaxID=995037 RepID=UPI000CF38BFC|nr:Fic family protein [Cryobacterium aureum]